MTWSSHTFTSALALAAGSAYSRPVRSWMRRRSPGGANDSSVTGRREKTSLSSSSEPLGACSFLQAARFSGEQPQCTEFGSPPQLPRRRLPPRTTPMDIAPIRRANATTVTRRVASTRDPLAALQRKAKADLTRVKNTRRRGDSCQNSSRAWTALDGSFVRDLGRFLLSRYVVVTSPSSRQSSSGCQRNRYAEVTVDSRSLARGLVLGCPFTQ